MKWGKSMEIIALQPTIICWAFLFDFSIFGRNWLVFNESFCLLASHFIDRFFLMMIVLFHFHLQQLTDNHQKISQKSIQNLTRIENHLPMEFSSFKINWNRQKRNSFDFPTNWKLRSENHLKQNQIVMGWKPFVK